MVQRIILNTTAAIFVGGAMLLQDYVLATNLGISAEQDFYQFSYLIISNIWNILSGGTYFAVAIPLLLNSHTKHIHLRFFLAYFSIVTLMCIVGCYVLFSEPSFYKINNAQSFSNNLTLQLLIASIPIHLIASYFSVKVICKKLNFLATLTTAFIYLAIPMLAIFGGFSTIQAALAICTGVIVQMVALIFISHFKKIHLNDSLLNLNTISKINSNEIIINKIVEIFKIATASILIAFLNWMITAEYSSLGVGEVSKFLYATKPSNMIAAFLTIVIANYLLASFSEHIVKKEYAKFKKNVIHAYIFVFIISFIIICIWYFFNEYFYQLMFYKSDIKFHEINQMQYMSNITIFQLPLYMMGVVAWRGLNALSRNNEILKASTYSLILFNILNTTLSINFQYKLLIIYIGVYFFWCAYLMLSMSLIIQKLIKTEI